MSEKKLRAHALIGPYLFDYGKFSYHEYFFSGLRRHALYDSWPLLSPAPYAYKCRAKGDFTYITEKDQFALRGLCNKNGGRSDYWITANTIDLSLEEIKSNNQKMFTKNYIKISKKKLAKLYALLEPSLMRSFSLEHNFSAGAEMSSSGSDFNQADTVCQNVNFFCKENPSEFGGRPSCDCGETKKRCGCPKTIQIGTCYREDRDIYENVQISEDPPEFEWQFKRTDVYDYCKNNVTVKSIVGCKKGAKCKSPEEEEPRPKCGEAACGFTYCSVCWTYKGEECDRDHSVQLEGTIKYDAEDIYTKYNDDLKQLISPTYNAFARQIFIRFKFDGRRLSETKRKDRYYENWTITSKQRSSKERTTQIDNDPFSKRIFLYQENWVFNKIYRRAEKYLYGNIHDPLTIPTGVGGYFGNRYRFLRIGGYSRGMRDTDFGFYGMTIAEDNTSTVSFSSLGADTNDQELEKKCQSRKPIYNITNEVKSSEFTNYRIKYTFKNASRNTPFYKLQFIRGDHFYLKDSKEYVIFYHLYASAGLDLNPTYASGRDLDREPGMECTEKVPQRKEVGGYEPGPIIWVPKKGGFKSQSGYSPTEKCTTKVGCYYGQTIFEEKHSSWGSVQYVFAENMRKKLPDKKYRSEKFAAHPTDNFARAISTYKKFRSKFDDSSVLTNIEVFPTRSFPVSLRTDVESFQLQFFTPTFSKTRIAPSQEGVVKSNKFIIVGPYSSGDVNTPKNYADDPSWKQKEVGGYIGGYPTPPPFGCKNVSRGSFKGNFTNIKINIKTFKPDDYIKNIKWQKSPSD
jgi:hypothetical protein